jgi:hypothetical protein
MLDRKPNLPSGRVRVIVQSVQPPADVMEVLRRVHTDLPKKGAFAAAGQRLAWDGSVVNPEEPQAFDVGGRTAEERSLRPRSVQG